MIQLDRYPLADSERVEISRLLASIEGDLNLCSLWALMDQAWLAHGCDEQPLRRESLDAFYRDPVWVLNGMFIEQDAESMAHRRVFASVLASCKSRRILDVGGGFGTLARLLNKVSPESFVDLLEPYPTQCMKKLCEEFSRIKFVSSFERNRYDALVCTDVLEHVQDPLVLLRSMVASVVPGGYLLIANCFEPVIACHLPSTFHLRYSFDACCSRMGLRRLSCDELPYGAFYQKVEEVDLSNALLESLLRRSQRWYPLRCWSERWLSPVALRMMKAWREPMHYPRALFRRLR